jgi:membrane protein YqaA with SNARE-associated domain
MGRFADRLRALALALGAPGLFLVAFLDSSFLSLPEIADILVVYMVTHHKQRLVLYVISATLGSLTGCLLMYFVGRKGGEALVRKRFTTANVDRSMAAFRRHGLMAVLIPSLLPPPAPFKIFVLLAGVAGIESHRFIAAVALGRGLRYTALGLLAVRYGERALAYMHENTVLVSLVAVGLLVGGFVVYLVWSHTQKRSA